MTKRTPRPLGGLGDLIAVPYSFLAGYMVGLIAPLAAIAAMVAGIKLVTGKIPFIGQTWPAEEGEQYLSFKLMPPDQARDAFNREKERIGAELKKMSTEMEVIAKEAQVRAKASLPPKA